MGHITVGTGTTLAVAKGTMVKFAQNQGMTVNGTLNATGDAADPVYFTDYRDDVGGDTNGSDELPAPGWWAGIYIPDAGAASLQHCVLRYGGSVVVMFSSYGSHIGNIFKHDSGTLAMSNCTSSNSASFGVRISTTVAAHLISNNSVSENALYGIFLSDAGSGPLAATRLI